MKKNYVKRGMLLLGAAAIVNMAYAEYVDVTRQYIKDPTFVPEWQGSIGNVAEGVCETWSSAFQTYQNLGEMPAGKYVLTANAFYRCGTNDYSKANQAGNPDLNTCYIFINDAKTPVKGLWEGRDAAPNNMWEANEAFTAGEYLNTVEYNHAGGELIIGIRNTGCYFDEWSCFDNFKLTCDGTPIEVKNGDFAEGIDAKRSWNNFNSAGSEKVPDAQKDGATGGTYRKCGGSPYNTAQQVELPAGTYRFSMQCFHRYGSTVDAEGNYYAHKTGELTDAYGSMGRTPKDWFEANDYDQVPDGKYAHAYIFMSKSEAKPKFLSWDDSEDEGDLVNGVDARTRVKDCWEICNGDLSIMPQNNPMAPRDKDGENYVPYETKNNCFWFHDSGHEREAGAAFVNDPEKWYQYVEFTLDEPTTVWLGLGKDENTGDGYWHAWANIKLEVLVGGGETPAEKTVLWKNGVQSTTGMVNWDGQNRFGLAEMDGNAECTYHFSDAEWAALKSQTFYIVLKDVDPNWHSVRITDGWWSVQYRDGVEENSDLEVDNGDGTRTIEINLANSPLLDTMDEKHLLFTGANYVLDEIYIKGGAGISSVVAAPVMDGRIYNMLGIEVDSNYKGIVIKNGKKYFQR